MTNSQKFETDLLNNELVYYTFGIAPVIPSPEVRKELKEKYNISIQSMGCVINKDALAYNKMVDQYFLEKYHLSVMQVVKKLQSSDSK